MTLERLIERDSLLDLAFFLGLVDDKKKQGNLYNVTYTKLYILIELSLLTCANNTLSELLRAGNFASFSLLSR